MKKLLLVSCAVALLMSLMVFAQDTPKQDEAKQDTMKAEKVSTKAVSISGKISDDGKTFVGDKDSKSWTVSNPDALKGHEGHHVVVTAHVDADKNEIHVTSVKMAKETMEKPQ